MTFNEKGVMTMRKRIVLFVLVSMFIVTPLIADPPDNSGPNVVRYETFGWYFYYDKGMVAIHGADWPMLCEGGFPWTDLWRVKEIENPADTDLIMSLVKGDDVDTWIYPEWFIVFDQNGDIDFDATCENALSIPPIAAGTMDIIVTDNDIFGNLPHNRRNAWHMSAHGVLSSPSGDRMICNSGFKCVWDSDDGWLKCKDRINLHD